MSPLYFISFHFNALLFVLSERQKVSLRLSPSARLLARILTKILIEHKIKYKKRTSWLIRREDVYNQRQCQCESMSVGRRL